METQRLAIINSVLFLAISALYVMGFEYGKMYFLILFVWSSIAFVVQNRKTSKLTNKLKLAQQDNEARQGMPLVEEPSYLKPPKVEVEPVVNEIPEQTTSQFDSVNWHKLIRNAKDGGANSILAADILEKTSMTLAGGVHRISELNETNHLVDKMIKELVSISHDIQSVSSMTQMVSINAAIEAHKAGEHGKTFEVVASEISKLAKNVRALTIDVDAKLEGIKGSVALNRRACDDITTLLSGVNMEIDQFKKIILRVENLSTSQEEHLLEFQDFNRSAS